jgi:hypothetical protein
LEIDLVDKTFYQKASTIRCGCMSMASPTASVEHGAVYLELDDIGTALDEDLRAKLKRISEIVTKKLKVFVVSKQIRHYYDSRKQAYLWSKMDAFLTCLYTEVSMQMYQTSKNPVEPSADVIFLDICGYDEIREFPELQALFELSEGI